MINLHLQAVTDLYAIGACISDKGLLIEGSNGWRKPTVAEQDSIDKAVIKITRQNVIDDLLQKLIKLCDDKQKNVWILLLGYKATPAQIERYKRKYERAKAGEFDEKINLAIIKLHEEMLTKLDSFIDLTETLRCGVADLIDDGKFDHASTVMNQAQNFDINSSINDINHILQADKLSDTSKDKP